MNAFASASPASPPRKLGLLGGTFNPIHRCHLTLARTVLERLDLDQVLFIPTGDPPHKAKEDLAPASHRFEMVRLAIEGEARFSVTDIETRRQGVSYTIETITCLQASEGPTTALYFIIGLDAFLELGSWRRAEDLLRSCHFIVVSRPGARFAQLAAMSLLPRLDPSVLASLDRGAIDCARLALPGDCTLSLLSMGPCIVSASMVRRHVHEGASLAGLLPPPVERYIIRHDLYQERHNPTRFEG